MMNEPIPDHIGPDQMAAWTALMGRLGAPAEAAGEPSDVTSTPPAWFLATSSRRYHGAFILALYGQIQDKCQPEAALEHVWRHYRRVTLGNPGQGRLPSPVIDYKQTSDLVDYFFLERPQPMPGQPELSLEKCYHCGAQFIEQKTRAPAVCPCCSSGVSVQAM